MIGNCTGEEKWTHFEASANAFTEVLAPRSGSMFLMVGMIRIAGIFRTNPSELAIDRMPNDLSLDRNIPQRDR
jgi:hypothetical protein